MIFVSGFYDLSKHEPRRTSTGEWIEKSEWLLSQDIKLYFYGEHRFVSALSFEGASTVSVADPCIDFDIIPDHIARIEALLSRRGRAMGYSPDKDTARYLYLMRTRFDWMHRAARLSIGDEALTWVDLGLPHASDDSLSSVALRDPAPGKIRIAAISYVPHAARPDLDVYYSRHWWPVGGGLWSARGSEVRWLADQITDEWNRCLDLGFPVTDEMMLGAILFRHPEKFEVYYADHTSLAANWNGVTRSHRLISEMGVRALEDGDFDEAHDRFMALAEGVR